MENNRSAQSTSEVLMVWPKTFGFDEQTAESNSFQQPMSLPLDQIRKKAGQEFDRMVNGLRDNGVNVEVFDDPDPDSIEKPNAVFPNNWLSTWDDGRFYVYSMANASRRRERSQAAIDQLHASYNISDVIDLSDNENHGRYLEGTGGIVFDHINKIAFGCLSNRCNESLLREHADQLGYEPVVFNAYGPDGEPVYHTNLMEGSQEGTSVVCSEAIPDQNEREEVLDKLSIGGNKVVEISQPQMGEFCGNLLELKNADNGELMLAMSARALRAFTDKQLEILSHDKKILSFEIPTIETIGGGSVRCMLAEIYLPKK